MSGYCDSSDVFAYGLPRGSVPNPGRVAASALASTDAITLDVHGFDAGDPVVLRALDGGSLPSPLVSGTTYYAIPVDDSTFQLSASSGGAAIPLTTDGAGVVVTAPLPVASAISWASRVIDDMLPAHVVPLEAPYPDIVRMTAAELAGGKLAARGGFASVALTSVVDAAQKRLARWAQGIPIRGTNAPKAAGLAVSVSTPLVDSTGWRTFGGL